MATFINERLIIKGETGIDEVSMYLNDNEQIFVCNDEVDARSWFFLITKDDWPEIKDFIDEKLGED